MITTWLALGMACRLAAGEIGLARPVNGMALWFMASFIAGEVAAIFYLAWHT